MCCTVLSHSVMSNSLRPMHCSPPGSFVHGDSPGKNTGVGFHAFLQGIIPTQGSNPVLPHCRWILYHLSHHGSNPLLGIYAEETKTEKYTYTPLFITTLFTIAKTWKQPRCPLTDEWIKKLWYTCAMEYYSAIKWNTFEPILKRWINLEPIIQSEVGQKEKNKYILIHIYGI